MDSSYGEASTETCDREMNSNLSFQQAIDMHSIKEDVPHGRRIGRPSPFWMYNEKEVGKPHPVHGWPTFGPPLPM